jgi:ribosome-associated protein
LVDKRQNGKAMVDRPEDEHEQEWVSKSQRKRESHALQALGEALVALSPERLAGMPLPQALLEAVLEAQRIRQRGAHKRQLQYIGRLMREVDAGPIQAAVDALQQSSHAAVARQHRLERWRERLLDEGDAALEPLLEEYPEADRQHLRQLVRNARRERDRGQPPRNGRTLFRYLRELDEAAGA